MRIGRRPLFFTALAVLSLLLLEPTPADLRWVNLALGRARDVLGGGAVPGGPIDASFAAGAGAIEHPEPPSPNADAEDDPATRA